MVKRNVVISEELQSKMREVAKSAIRALEEKAKTDPKAAAELAKARKKGVIPDA